MGHDEGGEKSRGGWDGVVEALGEAVWDNEEEEEKDEVSKLSSPTSLNIPSKSASVTPLACISRRLSG